MIQLIKSPVIYNHEEHSYKLGDQYFQGITRLINKYVYSDTKYKNVPKNLLENARLRGTAIHEAVEAYFAENKIDETIPEVIEFVAKWSNTKYTWLASEFTVSDLKKTATNIDIVATEDNNTVILIDVKSTAKLDKLYLSWQLSANALLFELQNPTIKVSKLQAYWTRSGEFVDIDRLSDESVYAMLNFGETTSLITVDLGELTKLETTLDQFKKAQKLIDVQLKNIHELLLKQMRDNNIKSFENERIRITYVDSYTKPSIDTKLLKAEEPEIYAAYAKESIVKDSVRITVKPQYIESEFDDN